MHHDYWPNLIQFLTLRIAAICRQVSILMQCLAKGCEYVLIGFLSFGINSTKLNGRYSLYQVRSYHTYHLIPSSIDAWVRNATDLIVLAIVCKRG